ncbi:MAG: glycine cleavage T C-terminal barrel domain-containing protein [Acidimicrobiales bacterium]
MSQIGFGSRIRKSPFFDSTIEAGAAAFTIYNRMYMPVSYGNPDAEYELLTTAVALWDVAAERQVEIVGPDAKALVQYLSARNLESIKPGVARYAPLCDHNGVLINDPIVVCVNPDRYWLSIADSDVLLWVRAVAGERGDNVDVFEPDVSPLAIQGPLAEQLMADLVGPEMVAGLGFFKHCFAEIQGIPFVLCRSGWSKQGGFELFLTDGTRGNELWSIVMDAGEKYGIGPGTPNQQERIESGLLSYGSDHLRDATPLEVGLGAFVSLDNDIDFIGKAALLADRSGQSGRRPRRLVNVDINGPAISNTHPWPLTRGGVPVGELRNMVWSPRLQRSIGLAFVDAVAAEPGTVLSAQAEWQTLEAVVSGQPFGDPRA